MAKKNTVSAKDLAAIAATAIEQGAPITKVGEPETEKTEPTKGIVNGVGIASPMMAATAVHEIAERKAEDATSVEAHMQRLNGGVSCADFEKALHTVASFLALPVKRVDPRTGEILTFEMAKGEIEQLLNSVCYTAARLLSPADDFSSVSKAERARERVLRDQRALSEGNEIDIVEARRNIDSADYRALIVEGVEEMQEIAERVYQVRTGKEFKRPVLKSKATKVKVTDQDERNQLLAEMSKRTGVAAYRVEGDQRFDMATQSADDGMRAAG